jgi:zinc transport system substrate-binding protein
VPGEVAARSLGRWARVLPALTLAGLVLVLGACGGGPATPANGSGAGKLSVVASFYPIAYFAERIGGDKVDVFNPVPPGAEPHDLELSPRTVERIQGSSVLLYLGGGFQPAVDRALETVEGPGLLSKDVTDGIPRSPGAPEEGVPGLDPHVWLDPQLAREMSSNIEDTLVQADAGNETAYRANAETLRAELDALDRDMQTGLANCTRKEIVTSHAAFGYLARRYGLNEVPVAGLSPEAEPSPARLTAVIQLAKERDVKYIFFETLVEPRVAQVIATEVGAQTLVLNPIEGLTEEQAAAGVDYFSLMRENLANLRTGLACR